MNATAPPPSDVILLGCVKTKQPGTHTARDLSPLFAGRRAYADASGEPWFFGKWGCSYCEQVARRMPVSEACASCGFGD
jgi:hypothetical protein